MGRLEQRMVRDKRLLQSDKRWVSVPWSRKEIDQPALE